MFPTSARLAICVRRFSGSSLIQLLTGMEGRLEDGNAVVLCAQVWSALCWSFFLPSALRYLPRETGGGCQARRAGRRPSVVVSRLRLSGVFGRPVGRRWGGFSR